MPRVAAATIAGILSYEDAARVIARRSRIVRRKSGQGLMLAVEIDVERARAALAGFEDRVSLAANNGPTSCVLSGDVEAVTTLQALLEADGMACRLVRVDYASHSHHMDDLAAELEAALDGVAPAAANTALVSTVLVKQLAGAEMDASYWARNLREPVLFADAMAKLFDDGVTHVIEISPHPVLTPAIEQLAALRPEPASVLSTLVRDAGTASDFALAQARAFVAGLEPFGDLPKHASVALPPYPWQREKYWVPPSKRRGSPGPRLPLTLTPAPADHGAWQGALDIALDERPWLKDHQVHDAVVLPGTAMVAIALDAARARAGSLPRVLVDVRFHRDLTLGDEPVRVNAAWRDDVFEGGSFALMSLPAGAASWTEHVTARVHHGAQVAVHAAFPGHLTARPATSAEAFYRSCAARGLHYGPAFQGVMRIFVDGDAALGEVRLPEVCRGGLGPHNLHPALWDAALQVCLALCEDACAVVPTAVTRISLLQELSKPVVALWSHVVRREATRFDLALFDVDQRPVMVLEGLTVQRLAVAPALPDADRVHRLQFQDAAPAMAVADDGAWIVCGEASDGAQALVDALGGDRARLVRRASQGEDPRASAWLEALRAGREPVGIAFVAPRASAGLAMQRRCLLALTTLVNACAALATSPRLVIITANAQAATQDDQPDPGAALYWGVSRVVCREHAALQPRIVDVAPADAGWAADCAAELLANDGEDQVALRAGRRLVGRLVRGELAEGPEDSARTWTTPRQPFRLHRARPGLPNGLEYRPLCRRAPAAGEIEIEVTAAALNFIDVMKAAGNYRRSPGTPRCSAANARGVSSRSARG